MLAFSYVPFTGLYEFRPPTLSVAGYNWVVGEFFNDERAGFGLRWRAASYFFVL